MEDDLPTEYDVIVVGTGRDHWFSLCLFCNDISAHHANEIASRRVAFKNVVCTIPAAVSREWESLGGERGKRHGQAFLALECCLTFCELEENYDLITFQIFVLFPFQMDIRGYWNGARVKACSFFFVACLSIFVIARRQDTFSFVYSFVNRTFMLYFQFYGLNLIFLLC